MTEPMKSAKLTLIELNEVNCELLQQAADTLPLPSLKRLMKFDRALTVTEDVYDSGYLEPWVQWVSIHTGQPSQVHQIKHLGDVANLRCKQIWETLSDNGVTSGIWGVMNGSKRDAKNCKFFLCDPWTFGEAPSPHSLTGLTELAKYIAKNYLNLSPLKMLQYGFEYTFALIRFVGIAELLKASILLVEGLIKFGASNLVLGCFYEYTAAIAFLNQKRAERPDFSIVFFNILAHAQHHYWYADKPISAQLAYCFKVFDAVLESTFKDCPADTILVANGLSQINTNADPAWILYRPKDPEQLLRNLGVVFSRAEALMTHDAHVFFHNQDELNVAFQAMSEAHVGTKPLFFVERDEQNPLKLFYRLEFTDEAVDDTKFNIAGKQMRFLDHFEYVVLRTGKHCQEGFVLQNASVVPPRIHNHEIADHICSHFGIKHANLAARTI